MLWLHGYLEMEHWITANVHCSLLVSHRRDAEPGYKQQTNAGKITGPVLWPLWIVVKTKEKCRISIPMDGVTIASFGS